MTGFSKADEVKLSSCHPDLVRLMKYAREKFEFMIIVGYRNEQDQNAAYNAKTTKLKWPHSKHNHQPSLAVDIAPVKLDSNYKHWIDWKDVQLFITLSEHIFACAKELGIKIRWGGDFNMDGNITTTDAWDKPHYELIEV